jgi:hypothetical protein
MARRSTIADPVGHAAPRVILGLPYNSRGVLLSETQALGASVMISANSCWRKDTGLQPPGDAAWMYYGACLDSAGYTAMKQGGYRWTVDEYVDFVVQGGHREGRPFAWRWWAAMDYCCEPEIAADRAEVERRIDATVASLGETLDYVDAWREDGAHDLPDPLPTLQGRTVADYLRCADGLAGELRARGRDGLPQLVGIGSVCRRHLHGPDGLLNIIRGLDEALPSGVRFHLFGVKGSALTHLRRLGLIHRVESVDSLAWDYEATISAQKARISCTVEHRAGCMRRWYKANVDRARAGAPVVERGGQLRLFAGAA